MVDPGSMLLHDAVNPALADGRYRIALTPSLPAGVSGAPPPAGAFDVLVAGPAPDPSRVRSHPAAGAMGGFADDLPFVLLERRTLPWERTGFRMTGIPWLALVLTRDDGTPEATLVPPTGTTGGPAGTLTCTDLATQTRVLPRPDEVRLLAHVRESNVADAATGGDDDGWQAVVVANRLPRTTGRWRATLVSLDGRVDLLSAAAAVGLDAQWSMTFTVTTAGGGFGDRIRAISPTRFGDPARLVTVLDASGAVTVARQDRSGRSAPARYRSALAASASVPTSSVDAADGEVPDITSTAASELGRLLSAADPRLLSELATWHRARLHATSAAVQAEVLGGPALAPAARAGVAAPAAPVTEARPLSARLAAAAIGRWARADLGSAGRFGSAATPVEPGPLRPRRGGGWH